mmetsp:Transcript_41048/g.80351  ORF Transcript_41048/g.80351 Transcript_41048/m.80351 type:complete len:102 (-) Transcript_41048:933-1238(-)
MKRQHETNFLGLTHTEHTTPKSSTTYVDIYGKSALVTPSLTLHEEATRNQFFGAKHILNIPHPKVLQHLLIYGKNGVVTPSLPLLHFPAEEPSRNLRSVPP